MRVASKASCIVCAVCSTAAFATMPAASLRHFDVPREAAAVAVPEFARQAAVQILMPEEAARGHLTHAVRGTLSVADALRQLLQGTGLVVVSNDGHTIVLGAAPELVRKLPKPAPRRRTTATLPQPQEPLADIVVTAQRRSEDRQRVPITVVAIDADMAASAGVTRTTDLPMLIPGFLYTEGVGLGIPYVRGVGSTANGPGAENEVALYVDDVYQGSKAAAINSFPDLAQIELLKGPQGTLFGRNATGGLLQIETLEPQNRPSGFARFGYASYDTIDASVYATAPLNGRVTASVSAFIHDQRDGWGHNLPTGNPVNRSKGDGVRFKLTWLPDESTKIRIGADWSSIRSSIGSAYRPVDGALPANGDLFTAGRYDTVDTVDPLALAKTGGASIRVERAIGGTTLSSISAYRYGSWNFHLDEDWQPVNRLILLGLTQENAYSQEIRLVSPTGGWFQIQGGLYVYLASGTQNFAYSGDSLAPLIGTGIIGAQSTHSYALYAQAARQIDAATRLTLGGRYTIESRHLTGYQTQTAAGEDTVFFKQTDRRSTAKAPTWRIAIDHRVSANVMVYASYDRGFKSGGFNPGNLITPALRPEQIDAEEIGLKSEFMGRRLRINVAAFHYAWRNIQLQTNRNGIPLLANAAAAQASGVDIDTEVQLTHAFRLAAAAEVLHARFTNYPDARGSTPLPGGGNGETVIDGSGNRLPFSPGFTTSLSARYDIEAWGGDLQASATARYTTRYFSEANNFLAQPGYGVLNAQLKWQSRNRCYGVTVWSDNLTNSFYAVALTAQPAASIVSAAAPRTFGTTLLLNF